MNGLTAEAQRIYEERGDTWEYHLTLEVLQAEMKPILQRWDALKRGLYSKPLTRIPRADSIEWMLERNSEIERITTSFTALSNEEFARAWGAPGEVGDADAIVSTSKLFAEMCATALQWEESVRFAKVEPIFKPVQDLYAGIGGRFIEEAAKLPSFLASVLGDEDANGTQSLNMVLTLPDGWSEEVGAALDAAKEDFIAHPHG